MKSRYEKWLKVGAGVLIPALLLFACGGQRNNGPRIHHDKLNAHLLNLAFFAPDDDIFLSFPLWFNDSLIRAKKIASIERRIYPRKNASEAEGSEEVIPVPREIRKYTFDAQGAVSSVNITTYLDDRKVSEYYFEYPQKLSENGFAHPEERKTFDLTDNYREGLNNFRESELPARIRVHRALGRNSAGVLTYEDEVSGDFMYFLEEPGDWRNTHVSKLVKPNPQDWIVWGKPGRPVRKYHLANLVRESAVTDFTYFELSTFPLRIERRQTPFTQKRSFNYSKYGFCNGYVDSTFSGKKYLTRVETRFYPEDSAYPDRIVHRKENPDSDSGNSYYETFTYSYFE